jgi:pimeloyl-[acyl-carrier protein] methyl ester esterase
MRLHVESFGRGRPLALLHGWGFHSGVWAPIVAALADRFTLHCVDLPGHGRSRALRLGSLDALADAIARVIPDASLVAGWSMGALAAQRLAHRHPRKARALALIAGTPCFIARDGWAHGIAAASLERFARDLRARPASTLDDFVRLNALGAAGARRAIRNASRTLGERGFPDASSLEAGLALLRDTDLREEARHLRVPACAIHGRHDALVPVAAGRWLADSIPGARFVELERSAHLPFVSEPRAVAAALGALDG